MIEVKHLCRKYGEHRAVDDLSFTIENGYVYGFLGPNGAGKSTTMNMITGCLAATSGQILIDGYDIFEDAQEAKKRIGYLPEIPPLYQDMTVREFLNFVAKAKGVPKQSLDEQLFSVVSLAGLEEVEERLIKNLSKGYKQRVGIAQALLANPEIIILDEPTVGLDPKQIIEVRDLIRELGKDHTVILSSHILSEVRSVCDQILIISKGKLVANDTPENLEKLYAPKSFEEIFLELTGEEAEIAEEADALELLRRIKAGEQPAAPQQEQEQDAKPAASQQEQEPDVKPAVPQSEQEQEQDAKPAEEKENKEKEDDQDESDFSKRV